MNKTNDESQKIFDKLWAENEPARNYYKKLEDLRVTSISKDGFVTVVYNGMLDLMDIQTSLGFVNQSIRDAINSGLLRAIYETYELRDELKFEPDDVLLSISRYKENSRRGSQL